MDPPHRLEQPMIRGRHCALSPRHEHRWFSLATSTQRHHPLLLPACLLALLVHPGRSRAAETVDLALVLVSDVSRSIDDGEFKIEKRGYAAAFRDPKILAAIRAGAAGAIAVDYVEFAGENEVQTVVGWTIINDERSATDFISRLSAAPRSFHGRTSISAGIDRALLDLQSSRLVAERRVVDVCGDGTNNAGRDVGSARDDAVEAGVTINGLAIINDHPMSWTFAHVQPPGGLDNYYRQNVIGGVGSFVVTVHDFRDFGDAMTHKLASEVAELSPGDHRLQARAIPGDAGASDIAR